MTGKNYGQLVRDSGMDVFVVSYESCGGNCQEQMGYVKAFLREIIPFEILKNLVVASCNVSKNEMPWEFLVHSAGQKLRVLYSRFTDPGNWILFDEVLDINDLITSVKNVATFDLEYQIKQDEFNLANYAGYL